MEQDELIFLGAAVLPGQMVTQRTPELTVAVMRMHEGFQAWASHGPAFRRRSFSPRQGVKDAVYCDDEWLCGQHAERLIQQDFGVLHIAGHRGRLRSKLARLLVACVP